VVETTPRVRELHPKWTPCALAAWIKSSAPVRISGWMIGPNLDAQAKQDYTQTKLGSSSGWGMFNKTTGLYALMSAPVLMWALLYVPDFASVEWPDRFSFGYDISNAIVQSIVYAAPLISGDISVFGEITPVLFAGAIIALLPPSKDRVAVPAVVLAGLAYVAYIHLGYFFSTGAGFDILSATYPDTGAHPDIHEAQKVVLSLVSNVRTTSLVILGTIYGLRVRES
jgi:hypothetical protein